MASTSAHVLSASTVAVTAGRPDRVQGGPVNPPVVLSSTYMSQGVPGEEMVYTRNSTETWLPFEQTVALLEGASLPGLVFGSGMAAVAAALSLVPDGGVLVLPQHTYQTALGHVGREAVKHGWEVRLVDIADTAAVVAALDGVGTGGAGRAGSPLTSRPADVLHMESPTNPMLEVADLPALLAAARERGVRTIVDNTFATPLVQQPLAWGADVVLHSATKYLAGHSDVVLGVIVTDDAALREELHAYRSFHGAIAGPFEVWLALRGLRTLHLRVERSQANAVELARRLYAHPGVAEVRHPSLVGDPGHERATAHMLGYGSIIGLRPRTMSGRTPAQTADAVVAAMDLWLPATSLGGVASTLVRRRRFATDSPPVPDDLIRLSVGVEDVDDLWDDLDTALHSVACTTAAA
ncbi:MAG: PLP-dependent transferase [Cellulomonadaceae bacterium]|jgi:cystathionine gamma-synthase|nr:PLP-dependent transferase [Cellulomonadaceae bacterium]